MALLVGFIAKNLGRKLLLLFGDVVCFAALLILTVCSFLYANNTNEGLSVTIIIMVYVYCFGYGMSLGPIVWLYNAEILPEKGVSISTIANWSGVIFISFLFPICKDAFNVGPIFAFFAVCTVFGYLMI